MITTVVFVSLMVSSATATTFVNRPLGDVVKETPIIARGRTGDSYSDWDKGGRRTIFTYTHFTITEVLKGELKETKILLRQPGGAKDGMEMAVPGVAHFNLDEDVVAMLGERNTEDGAYDLPGFSTGKYNVVKGENGEPVLVSAMGGAAMYDPAKDARTLSYNSRLPLEVFRRIAKGEDVPEAAHKQFERSAKPAPAGAYEADHDKHVAPQPKAPAPKKDEAAPARSVDSQPPPVESRGLWVPISFGILAAVGAAVFWRASKGSKTTKGG